MPRIRTIKPEFWRDPKLSKLSAFSRLMAIAVLNLADDEGYFEADPRLVRGDVFPFEEDSRSTTVALRELSDAGYIEVRDASERGEIGLVKNFKKHQVINKPTPSKLKQYFNETPGKAHQKQRLPEDYGSTTVGLPPGTGKGNREKEEEQGEGKENSLALSKHGFSKEFIEAWSAWKGKQQKKSGVLMDEWTEKGQLFNLERFATEEAIEVVRFSTSRTNCVNLVLDGSHKTKDAAKVGTKSKKDEVNAILERAFGNAG